MLSFLSQQYYVQWQRSATTIRCWAAWLHFASRVEVMPPYTRLLVIKVSEACWGHLGVRNSLNVCEVIHEKPNGAVIFPHQCHHKPWIGNASKLPQASLVGLNFFFVGTRWHSDGPGLIYLLVFWHWSIFET